jgi:hypothetical protein
LCLTAKTQRGETQRKGGKERKMEKGKVRGKREKGKGKVEVVSLTAEMQRGERGENERGKMEKGKWKWLV